MAGIYAAATLAWLSRVTPQCLSSFEFVQSAVNVATAYTFMALNVFRHI